MGNTIGNATSVYTQDLSDYFHFVPSSHLVIGTRMAEGMRTLLGWVEIPSTLPLAPPGLLAMAHHRIQLNWADHAENEEGYWIERSTGPGEDFELIASVPANTTSYQDPGLSHSTTYYYRVSAYNIKGDSDYTQVISATTFQPNTETQLPAVWNTGDVGNPSLAGQIDYFGGTFTINGSGEMWKNSDDFHFVYQSFTGDGEIIAQCRVKAQMAGKAAVDFVEVKAQKTSIPKAFGT